MGLVSGRARIIATLVNYRQQQGREKGVARDDLRADYARVRDERDGLLKRVDELEKEVDALIVIPNDRIFSVVDKNTTLKNAFAACDEILRQAVEGISELTPLAP